jgi:hypothetical protein
MTVALAGIGVQFVRGLKNFHPFGELTVGGLGNGPAMLATAQRLAWCGESPSATQAMPPGLHTFVVYQTARGPLRA